MFLRRILSNNLMSLPLVSCLPKIHVSRHHMLSDTFKGPNKYSNAISTGNVQVTRVGKINIRNIHNKQPDLEIKLKEKEQPIKERFKNAAKQYGPIFVGVHIGLSLVSVGFFYCVVSYTVDPIKYLPRSLMEKVQTKFANALNEGSTFVLAYALHKAVFPLRLAASLAITPYLSKRIFRLKYFNKKKTPI